MTNKEALETDFLTSLIKDPSAAPGPRNAAPYLLLLDTVELRERAVARAQLEMNLSGGNWSGSVYAAVQETLAIGLQESPAERWNREMLEREHIAKCLVTKETCPSPMHRYRPLS